MKHALVLAMAILVTPPAIAADRSINDTLRERLNVIATTFQQQGGRCPYGQPRLVNDIVPTFGEYDGDRNELHITLWEALSAEGKGHYAELVGKSSLADAQSIYESANYQWVFVHELGHWWQHCTGKDKSDPYASEMGADRIATAYWRSKDPALMARFAQGFAGLTRSLIDTTPPGITTRAYFDKNIDELSRNPRAYIWYQAKMIVDAYKEHPAPTLRETLQSPDDVPAR